ncbi:pseudouridylate synthase 7 homolog [Galleria mellonella]|uniref:Pseudouridylate synthase 7 homolog n=1 Tax=Galleria mellonella TaxID=7137 RepID=A0ABM3MPS2_GALME|nr:pseudouridylate synthase 7 homolog [Galleria mellonella]
MNKERGSNWNHRKWDHKRGPHRGGFKRGGAGRGPANQGFYNSQQYNNFDGFRGDNSAVNNYGARNNYNQQWQNTPGKRLTEKDIGVTEYVSDHEGFSGIIKARYSDFQVAEINEKGEIAKLTDLEPPKPPTDDTVDEDEDLLLSKYNVEILPMETWDRINKLVVTEDSTEKVEIDVTGMTKEQRTKIHDAAKKAFGQSIVGSTVSVDDKKFVRFEKYRKGVRIDNRVKWVWPGEYVYFIVHKENCDTMDAARRIAEKLRINMSPAMLGYAGTKDRRAKTSQWFSARKVDPRRLAAAARALPGLLLGNYSFARAPLKLGMLRGNRFRIALRDVRADDEHVQRCVQLLRERGFVNYYGLQRFGAHAAAPTHAIGLCLARGELRAALDCVLRAPSAHAHRGLRRALAANPRDLLGALHALSRNTRLLYLHSYQSLVWNRAVSERLRRFGLRPAVGDLVPPARPRGRSSTRYGLYSSTTYFCFKYESIRDDLGEELDAGEDAGEDLSDSETHLEDIQEETMEPMDPMESTSDSAEQDNKSIENKEGTKPKIPVKILTEEDIESGKYTIFDIIMPLPGYNIEYPPNMKDYYVELLQKDGLTTELKQKIKELSLSGAYRRVVVRPGALSHRAVRYSDPRADLLLSDRDRLARRTRTAAAPGEYAPHRAAPHAARRTPPCCAPCATATRAPTCCSPTATASRAARRTAAAPASAPHLLLSDRDRLARRTRTAAAPGEYAPHRTPHAARRTTHYVLHAPRRALQRPARRPAALRPRPPRAPHAHRRRARDPRADLLLRSDRAPTCCSTRRLARRTRAAAPGEYLHAPRRALQRAPTCCSPTATASRAPRAPPPGAVSSHAARRTPHAARRTPHYTLRAARTAPCATATRAPTCCSPTATASRAARAPPPRPVGTPHAARRTPHAALHTTCCTHRAVRYSDPRADLLLSDRDRLARRTRTAAAPGEYAPHRTPHAARRTPHAALHTTCCTHRAVRYSDPRADLLLSDRDRAPHAHRRRARDPRADLLSAAAPGEYALRPRPHRTPHAARRTPHAALHTTCCTHRAVRYSDPRADLLLSDRDRLARRTRTAAAPDGEYKALLLTMSLPSSCYATMALRELLRVDTSSDTQASKNDYYIKKESITESVTKDVKLDPVETDTEATLKAVSVSESGEKRKLESESEGEIKKSKKEDPSDNMKCDGDVKEGEKIDKDE